MLILLAVIAIGLIGGVFASYLRNTQNNIGGGIGKNYMEEHWGISDNMTARVVVSSHCSF